VCAPNEKRQEREVGVGDSPIAAVQVQVQARLCELSTG